MRAPIDVHICGIPCQVRVTHYLRQRPDSRADNPDDYYGYVELEYDVLDRRGRPAPWLERKLDQREIERLEEEIINHQEN